MNSMVPRRATSVRSGSHPDIAGMPDWASGLSTVARKTNPSLSCPTTTSNSANAKGFVIRIAGERLSLRRAVDDEGEVLDTLAQRRRDTGSALRFMRRARSRSKTACRNFWSRTSFRPTVQVKLDPAQRFLSMSRSGFTTSATFNVTSSPDRRCGSSEPKLLQSGKMPSQLHDAWGNLALNACSIQLL